MTVTVPFAAEPEPVAAGEFVEDAGEQPTATAVPAAAPVRARNLRRDSPWFVVVMSFLAFFRGL
jgi:hypothetical protein